MMFALAACDSDPTPIVPMAAAAALARVEAKRGTGRDNKLGLNDRLENYSSLRTTYPHWGYTLDAGTASLPSLDRQRPGQRLDDH